MATILTLRDVLAIRRLNQKPLSQDHSKEREGSRTSNLSLTNQQIIQNSSATANVTILSALDGETDIESRRTPVSLDRIKKEPMQSPNSETNFNSSFPTILELPKTPNTIAVAQPTSIEGLAGFLDRLTEKTSVLQTDIGPETENSDRHSASFREQSSSRKFVGKVPDNFLENDNIASDEFPQESQRISRMAVASDVESELTNLKTKTRSTVIPARNGSSSMGTLRPEINVSLNFSGFPSLGQEPSLIQPDADPADDILDTTVGMDSHGSESEAEVSDTESTPLENRNFDVSNASYDSIFSQGQDNASLLKQKASTKNSETRENESGKSQTMRREENDSSENEYQSNYQRRERNADGEKRQDPAKILLDKLNINPIKKRIEKPPKARRSTSPSTFNRRERNFKSPAKPKTDKNSKANTSAGEEVSNDSIRTQSKTRKPIKPSDSDVLVYSTSNANNMSITSQKTNARKSINEDELNLQTHTSAEKRKLPNYEKNYDKRCRTAAGTDYFTLSEVSSPPKSRIDDFEDSLLAYEREKGTNNVNNVESDLMKASKHKVDGRTSSMSDLPTEAHIKEEIPDPDSTADVLGCLEKPSTFNLSALETSSLSDCTMIPSDLDETIVFSENNKRKKPKERMEYLDHMNSTKDAKLLNLPNILKEMKETHGRKRTGRLNDTIISEYEYLDQQKKEKAMQINHVKKCQVCMKLVKTSTKKLHVLMNHMNERFVHCPACNFTGASMTSVGFHIAKLHEDPDLTPINRIGENHEAIWATVKVCFPDDLKLEKMPANLKTCNACQEKVKYRFNHVAMRHQSEYLFLCPECPFASRSIRKKVVNHVQRVHRLESTKVIDMRAKYEEKLKTLISRCFTQAENREDLFVDIPLIDPSTDTIVTNDATSLGEIRLTCSLCKQIVGNDRVTMHVKAKHDNLLWKGKPEVIRMCFEEERKKIRDQKCALLVSVQDRESLQQPDMVDKRSKANLRIECKLCKKSVTKNAKTQHVVIHHLGQPLIACPVCSHTEKYQKRNMDIHIKKAHKDSPDAESIDYRKKYLNRIHEIGAKCFGQTYGLNF